VPPFLWAVLTALQATQPAPATPVAKPQSPPAPTYRVPPPELRKPIDYESVQGLTIFRAKVGGQDTWVLADNGAQRTVVDLGFAAKAKLSVDRDVAGRITAGKGMDAHRVRNVSVSVEGQFDTTLPVLVGADLAGISRAMGREIGMVMGADFYHTFAVIVLSKPAKMRIVRSGQTPIPMKPMTLLANASAKWIPQVAIEVDGQPLTLSIDMGASITMLISPQAWSRIGKNLSQCSDDGAAIADGSRVPGKRCITSTAKVGPLTLNDFPVMVGDVKAKFGDGLIGMGALKAAGGVILDIRDHKMWLLPNGVNFERNAASAPPAN